MAVAEYDMNSFTSAGVNIPGFGRIVGESPEKQHRVGLHLQYVEEFLLR